MDIGDNFSNSLDYAKQIFSDGVRLIILVILNLIPIVNWIVLGYSAKVLKDSPQGKVPPKLNNYGDLFVNGAKIFVVTLIYMIVPFAFFGLVVWSLIWAMLIGGFRPEFMTGARPLMDPTILSRAFMFTGLGLGLFLVGVVLTILLLVFLAAALAHMIKTGDFAKAFAFSDIAKIIGRIGWAKYIGWVLLILLISFAVFLITTAIPFIGWLLSVIIAPALAVFIARSLGILYSEGAK